MEKQQYAGVFQLQNGNWGYRFIVTVEGKRKAQKRVMTEAGKPYTTAKQAAKAREKAIAMEKARLMMPQKKKLIRKTVEEVYNEYCEKGIDFEICFLLYAIGGICLVLGFLLTGMTLLSDNLSQYTKKPLCLL